MLTKKQISKEYREYYAQWIKDGKDSRGLDEVITDFILKTVQGETDLLIRAVRADNDTMRMALAKSDMPEYLNKLINDRIDTNESIIKSYAA